MSVGMTVLFLDDCPFRTKKFRRECPCASCFSTAASIIAALTTANEIDMLFLDHDLGGQVYQNSADKETGMEVVRWIVANKPKIKKVYIHSLNFPASIRMQGHLEDAGYAVSQIAMLDFASVL